MILAEEEKLKELEAKLADAQKSIEALSAKNKELLDEKRQTKSGAERQLMEAQDRISELEGQLTKAQTDAKKAADKFATDLKTAQDVAASKSATLSKLIKDEGLARELLSAGVKNPAHLKAAQAMLREQVAVDEEKGEAYVMLKDDKGVETRKSLGEFVKMWGASDEGKAFVMIPGSSGSGTSGGSVGAGGSDFSKMTPTQVMEYAKQGAAQLAEVSAWQKTTVGKPPAASA